MKFSIIAVGEKKPDFQSRLIQRGIMADYSHIAILVELDGFVPEVYESVGKGIVISELEDVLDHGEAVIRHKFPLKLVVSDGFALGWLRGSLGRGKYSLIQYLGFLFPFLRWIPAINNGRAFSVCSEFAADFLVDCCGIKFDDCDFVSPRDVVERLKEHEAIN